MLMMTITRNNDDGKLNPNYNFIHCTNRPPTSSLADLLLRSSLSKVWRNVNEWALNCRCSLFTFHFHQHSNISNLRADKHFSFRSVCCCSLFIIETKVPKVEFVVCSFENRHVEIAGLGLLSHWLLARYYVSYNTHIKRVHLRISYY